MAAVKTKNKPATRAEIMRAVKSKNTSPEKFVRSTLHKQGFRFRLHTDALPGKPDIVLPKYKTVIRVMGCFWHGHRCKRGNRIPKTNRSYWTAKISRNRTRDKTQKRALEGLGWRVIDLWECQLITAMASVASILKKHFRSSLLHGKKPS
ncbi:MAG: DNA mismatch endonuclease Vsr [Alphaproteobacteria bacterium]|nr:MAG: DNA mismatch endonuclease Vsr [Alphaproteobacteria bacterium]